MPKYKTSRKSRKYQYEYYHTHKVKSSNPSHRPSGAEEDGDPATRAQRIREWMDKINEKFKGVNNDRA
jgi:hypothetical protein